MILSYKIICGYIIFLQVKDNTTVHVHCTSLYSYAYIIIIIIISSSSSSSSTIIIIIIFRPMHKHTLTVQHVEAN